MFMAIYHSYEIQVGMVVVSPLTAEIILGLRFFKYAQGPAAREAAFGKVSTHLGTYPQDNRPSD